MSRGVSVLSRGRRDTARPPESPAAARPRRAWWRDARVIAGIGIVVVCTIAGARLMSSGDAALQVWQVNRDLAAGSVPGPDDVTAVALPADIATAYVAADGLPTSRLARDLRAGELLPPAVPDATVDVRWVTVPVEPLHAPSDLAAGERVDVWATDTTDLSGAARPQLVLAGALVSAVSVESVGFGGEYGIVLEVEPQSTGDVLAAVRSGAVDLVRVPLGQVNP